MIITTKLAPGEKGFVLHGNKAVECIVLCVGVVARVQKFVCKSGSGTDHQVVVDTKYALDLGSTLSRDNHIHNVEEASVFKTKEDLLKSL